MTTLNNKYSIVDFVLKNPHDKEQSIPEESDNPESFVRFIFKKIYKEKKIK